MNLFEEKRRLRTSLKQIRNHLPEKIRAEKSEAIRTNLHKITAFTEAKSIFCFISYLSEVDTHPLITTLLKQDRTLAVPKIIGMEHMIAVQLTDWDELTPGQMGILTPKSNQLAIGPFDIALTPGLGFTEKGERLGYGRGYYDQWFINYEVKIKIGIAFEVQIIDKLPVGKTDVLLDMLVTEDRIISLRN